MEVVAAQDAEPDPVPGGHDDAGRPDLHVELVDLTGGQRLDLIVRVPRLVLCAERAVQLSVRCPQPALAHGAQRVHRTLEGDLPSLWVEHVQHEEQVCVGRGRGDEQLRSDGARDLELLGDRVGEEPHSVSERVEGHLAALGRCLGETPVTGVNRTQVRPRPHGVGDRPIRFTADLDDLTGPADVELNPRLVAPAGVVILQVAVEEPHLKVDP